MRGSILFITSTWSCSMTCWFLSSCPTSNHNKLLIFAPCLRLYIVLFLHQTTTSMDVNLLPKELYIVLFLHQTTTSATKAKLKSCCISYYSYIKPQLFPPCLSPVVVVYRTIPTSNHNFDFYHNAYIKLYIVLFLHQTTTTKFFNVCMLGCISYYSYIKPQRWHVG